MKPFIKWAGGKRWLLAHKALLPRSIEGRYIEPFLGGGAVFFHLKPVSAILSDLNPRLIETYKAITEDPAAISSRLKCYQERHTKEFYYQERSKCYLEEIERAAQFLYLNRTCFNGLYRENLSGKFNVPIGTKTQVVLPEDDFEGAAAILRQAELKVSDFEEVIDQSRSGDFLFIDPPYTTAHNFNGFVKYNQKIFCWEDQVRLREAIVRAIERGANIALTNADHPSVHELYADLGVPEIVSRSSVISGSAGKRGSTTEALYRFQG